MRLPGLWPGSGLGEIESAENEPSGLVDHAGKVTHASRGADHRVCAR